MELALHAISFYSAVVAYSRMHARTGPNGLGPCYLRLFTYPDYNSKRYKIIYYKRTVTFRTTFASRELHE